MVKIMENPIKMDDFGGKTHHFRKHPNGLAITFILFTKSVHMLTKPMSMYRISITSIYYVYININHSEVCKKNTSTMDGMEMHGNAWLFAGKSSFPSIQSLAVPKLDLEKTFSVGPKTASKWGNTLPETNNPFSGAKMLVVGRV